MEGILEIRDNNECLEKWEMSVNPISFIWMDVMLKHSAFTDLGSYHPGRDVTFLLSKHNSFAFYQAPILFRFLKK